MTSGDPPNPAHKKQLLANVVWLFVFTPLMFGAFKAATLLWGHRIPLNVADWVWRDVKSLPGGNSCFRCGKSPATRPVTYGLRTVYYCGSCESYNSIKSNAIGASDKRDKTFAAIFVSILVLGAAALLYGGLIIIPFMLANKTTKLVFGTTSQPQRLFARLRARLNTLSDVSAPAKPEPLIACATCNRNLTRPLPRSEGIPYCPACGTRLTSARHFKIRQEKGVNP